ncbi:hypothetical protein QUF76_04410 [Desulfobacterales bacterium HSG16]|nr:hypothetical protein [Desulfobacterales bacterium HSG16]
MSRFIKMVFILIMTMLCSSIFTIAAEDEPLVLLIQAKGNVSCSTDGTTWKKVRRNKFLYDGSRVKTGDDGACKLIRQQTGMIKSVGSNAEVEIRMDETKALEGVLSEARSAGNLKGFLNRKFAKLQKHTALHRGGKRGEQVELKTARNITLSEDYPDMVWENLGTEYSYQLTVGKEVFDIPVSCNPVVRFKLSRMKPGQSEYSVDVLYNGEILYTPEKKGKLLWLSNAEKEDLLKRVRSIQQVDPDNGFLLGSFMDKQGLKVAAMDQYHKFLSENPDANEARAFLIKVLNDLKLKKIKGAEKILYHKHLGIK